MPGPIAEGEDPLLRRVLRLDLPDLPFQAEPVVPGLRTREDRSRRRELDAAAKATSFLLLALIPLVVHLLASAWPAGGGERSRDSGAPL